MFNLLYSYHKNNKKNLQISRFIEASGFKAYEKRSGLQSRNYSIWEQCWHSFQTKTTQSFFFFFFLTELYDFRSAAFNLIPPDSLLYYDLCPRKVLTFPFLYFWSRLTKYCPKQAGYEFCENEDIKKMHLGEGGFLTLGVIHQLWQLLLTFHNRFGNASQFPGPVKCRCFLIRAAPLLQS